MKLVILGDGAVGKTALRSRYIGKSFTGDYIMTIGADFSTKEVRLGDLGAFKFQIWDLAGQPRYSKVRDLYYTGSLGALVVYDVARPATYMNMQEWINGLWTFNGKGKIPLIVVANKIDLREGNPNTITFEYGENYAKRLSELTEDAGFSIHYIETSAKTGENVELAFELLTKEILKFIKASPSLKKVLS